MSDILKNLLKDPSLFTRSSAYETGSAIMSQALSDAQVGAILIALKTLGKETNPSIIAGFADAMREAAHQVSLSRSDYPIVVDIVGTGGDGQDTFNVSTAAGMVVAGASKTLKVAKHGNRSSSSSCGSADVLEAMNCSLISMTPEKAISILKENNFCFLFSQAFHPAMKRVAGPRKELGVRTIFNLLGPLTNPARPNRMVVGVASRAIGHIMAEALKLSGVERAWVVHGDIGLDEISPEGNTIVWSLETDGSIHEKVISPADFGLSSHSLSQVRGGNPSENAAVMHDLLSGKLTSGPLFDYVIMNAGALLYIAGETDNLQDAAQLAATSLISGAAGAQFERFLNMSNV